MGSQVGKEVRQSYFLPADQPLIRLLDLSRTAAGGALPGTENIRELLEQCTQVFHGIILNPGNLEKNADLLGGKIFAAGLVRADWTNALRPSDFALHVQKIQRVMISDADDAVALGAVGMVTTLLMGYDDEFEADNIEAVSHLARACYQRAMPLLMEILPAGPNVTPVNHDGVVELGVSFAMEAGADALIVPPVSEVDRQLLASWVTVPLLERRREIPEADDALHLVRLGYRGLVFGEEVVAERGWVEKIERLAEASKEAKVE